MEVLGGLYRSSEEALKELVANCWDADASRVDIEIPLALESKAVVVRDDGCGMTLAELEHQYLGVAFDRRRTSGDTTPRGRSVRGHLGIGKFAGFVAASRMTVSTTARGIRCRMVLDKVDLQASDDDLEEVTLAVETDPYQGSSGTTVELSLMRPGLEQPNPKKLGAILLREFGYRDDFAMFIDGERLNPDILAGKKVQFQLPLSGGTVANVTAWLLQKEREVAETGIVTRVAERAIGPTSYYGLDEDPEIPRSVLRRTYVEVQADHLEGHVMANWGGIVENSDRPSPYLLQADASAGRESLPVHPRQALLRGGRSGPRGRAGRLQADNLALNPGLVRHQPG